MSTLFAFRNIPVRAALALGLCTAIVPASFAAGATGSVASQTANLQFGKASVRGSVDIKRASATLKRGLKALDKKNMKAALQARAALKSGTLERKVMAWAIAMDGRGVDAKTLLKISNDLSGWPGAKKMRLNIEKALAKEASDAAIKTAFSQSQPEGLTASLELAKAHLRSGNRRLARKAIAPIWHSKKLSKSDQSSILKKFGSVLTREDHRARVEYLLSRKRVREAQRIAGKASMTSLVKARAAVMRKSKAASKALSSVPSSQRKHPNYLISKAQYLRNKGHISNASALLRSIDPRKLHSNAGNAAWIETRILASDLLEAGKPKAAYRIASRNLASSASKRIDAEFYAGWIALRKLKDAKTAQTHFRRLLKIASTPLSLSRGHYWLGRALAKGGRKSDATHHYKLAANYDTTYYGQLAASKLGRSKISISTASPSYKDRVQFPQYELVQALAKLESAGHPRRARNFYRHLARHMKSSGELALLSARAEKRGDFQLALQIGKIGFQKGMKVDKLAWPVGAISLNTRVGKSGLPLAYAISRQESTFQVDARSHANALGLMQLLPGTAKQTARNIGIRYSRSKLTTSASYNARLGTAYLDQQMKRFGGSLVLTFIAYNAGPRRVDEWIARNGDPRGASTDFVVDWVEQIPFSETRNYVQRVMENLQVYNKRIKGSGLTIEQDLRRGRGV